MEHFISVNDVDRIELDKEFWVDIKHRMTYGDQQRLVASYMRMQTRVKAGTANIEGDIEVDLESGNITLLLLNIKAWNLVGHDGKAVAVNDKTVRQLSIDTATRLVEEINIRNPSPKA